MRQTLQIPVDPRNEKRPMITNAMQANCIGEFSWTEESPYYDGNGNIIEHEATRTVPWNICKEIYRKMALVAAKPVKCEGYVKETKEN